MLPPKQIPDIILEDLAKSGFKIQKSIYIEEGVLNPKWKVISEEEDIALLKVGNMVWEEKRIDFLQAIMAYLQIKDSKIPHPKLIKTNVLTDQNTNHPYLLLEFLIGKTLMETGFKEDNVSKGLVNKIAGTLAKIHEFKNKNFGIYIKQQYNPRFKGKNYFEDVINELIFHLRSLREGKLKKGLEHIINAFSKNAYVENKLRRLKVFERVHSDFNPGNIMLNQQNEVIGIIDWEYSHFGSKYRDLGHLLNNKETVFTKSFIESYSQKSDEKFDVNLLSFFIEFYRIIVGLKIFTYTTRYILNGEEKVKKRLKFASHKINPMFQKYCGQDIKDIV